MPRATTAAWLVMPPRVVRMPRAACMPWMSSGLVSMRTRMIASPFCARLSASSAREHHRAATPRPGWPAGPSPAACAAPSGSSVGCSNWSSEDGLTRRTASDWSIRPSRAMSTAMRRLRGGGALAVAGLQHVQLVLLHGELDVLHVVVVLLELLADLPSARRRPSGIATSSGVSSGLAPALDSGCGVRMPATTSSPCAFTRYSP